MPSQAAIAHFDARARAKKLMSLVVDVRLRPISRDDSRVYLHAALAAHVAGWESYIERLIGNFFVAIVDNAIPKYLVLHGLFLKRSEHAASKFNTPSWEKSRELLSDYTGYDPINDWDWPNRRLTGPLLRARLNEILKVRHSFAHGFPMEKYAWNTSAAGEVRLTHSILSDVDALFLHLVKRTDKGMKSHLRTNFGVQVSW